MKISVFISLTVLSLHCFAGDFRCQTQDFNFKQQIGRQLFVNTDETGTVVKVSMIGNMKHPVDHPPIMSKNNDYTSYLVESLEGPKGVGGILVAYGSVGVGSKMTYSFEMAFNNWDHTEEKVFELACFQAK